MTGENRAMPVPHACAICVDCRHPERIGENGENVCTLCGGRLDMLDTEQAKEHAAHFDCAPCDIDIIASLPEPQAWALAEFCKRVGWQELRQNAANEGEAYDMRDAIGRLQKALAEAGFSPR